MDPDNTAYLETVKDVLDSRTMLAFDHFKRPLILFANQFTLNYFTEKHGDIHLLDALQVKQLTTV
jgi:peptide chain release factor 3